MLNLQVGILVLLLTLSVYWQVSRTQNIRKWAQNHQRTVRVKRALLYFAVGLLALFGTLSCSARFDGYRDGRFESWAFLLICAGALSFVYLQTLGVALVLSLNLKEVTKEVD